MSTLVKEVDTYLRQPSGRRQQINGISLQDVEHSTSLWKRVMQRPVKKYGALRRRISSGKRNPIDNTSYQMRKVLRAMHAAGHEMDDLLLIVADLDYFVRSLFANAGCARSASLALLQDDAAEDEAQLRYHDSQTHENLREWVNKAMAERAALDRAIVAGLWELAQKEKRA
jgi:hypothetical protein